MSTTEPLRRLPQTDTTNFTLSSAHHTLLSPRLGRLTVPGRNSIETPHYLALSSRGCVPHLTPDVMLSSTQIQGVYTGFEDYAESLPAPPPFTTLAKATPSPLRTFTALPASTVLILGPRRHPAIPAPSHNTATSLHVSTSIGFRQMSITNYLSALDMCGPDIGVGIVDADVGSVDELSRGRGVQEMSRTPRPKPGRKRADHMVERSQAWIRGLMKALEVGSQKPQLWAPILPLDSAVQRSYLEVLEEAAEVEKVGGIVIYENASVDAIPVDMHHIPLLALTEPRGPSDVLDAVALGIDLHTLPFITRATEAGIAFTFKFPAPSNINENSDVSPLSLGIDLWSPIHAQSVSPLNVSCTCYACTRHHRAYINHLLQAKEMLAWVLLQIHNHWMIDAFFAGIRESIASDTFEVDVERWKRAYESALPDFVGQGPRIRGYQSSVSGPLPKKKNKAPYTRLEKRSEMPERPNDRKEKLKEDGEGVILSEKVDALDLEDIGFAKVFQE